MFGVWPIRVFLGFFDFFNLTKPLNYETNNRGVSRAKEQLIRLEGFRNRITKQIRCKIRIGIINFDGGLQSMMDSSLFNNQLIIISHF